MFGHTWLTTVHNRVSGSGCPDCKKLNNCIALSHPKIAKQLHPINVDKAYEVSYGSNIKL